MKRKIKRKLLLMGVAMVAGAYAPAHAKGNGKSGHADHDYSATWSVQQYSTLPFSQTRYIGALPGGLLNKFRAALDGLDLSVEGGAGTARRQGMRLQLFQSDAGISVSEDPRLSGKHVGLALRVAF
ncbi:MAG: hypothetical protein Q8M09_18800 [Pseudomonadota bacterium]|nr:hypothetical protein [Pseudomonadota bacterium]MDP1906265.1 hypothetical protein [Pseudomonadota bacterium]MDP2353811.1 hypothetical protein [Pseudomonadota bacterium]